jgi:DNA-binding HxlR family transcriptional regulator
MSVALDLIGRRTSLRLLWELKGRSLTFRKLQQACETNSRLLNGRLAEFKEAGLIEHQAGGYTLTVEGRRLSEALTPLAAWAAAWKHGTSSST